MCGAEQALANGDQRSSSADAVINLDYGDPKIFEEYWKKIGDKCTITIPGYQALSYFSDTKGVCWFMEPELMDEIRRVHRVVGNAVTDDRHIVVGTGSIQLFQAALYALSSPDAPQPMNVVASAPYYSLYPAVTDVLKSRLYQWAGDAYTYNKEDPYVEIICSPNNPDGYVKHPVVNRDGGALIHDLAYYWPQYTAITAPADHDIMLFTFSKSTGHAGNRIGWAIVKDFGVAKKMTKFIELNTIGVSKASQLRAAKILQTVSDSCEHPEHGVQNIFLYGRQSMAERWERLREVIRLKGLFRLPDYPIQYCNFSGELTETHPAFAWLESKTDEIKDSVSFFECLNILTRAGKFFGKEDRFTRVSMTDTEESFNLFLERISSLKSGRLENGI